MAKERRTERSIYGEVEPTSVNLLNKEYMTAYLKDKLASGAITTKKISDYKKKKNDAIAKKENESGKPLKDVNKSQIERRVFVDCFMPELIKATKKIDFDAELDALING